MTRGNRTCALIVMGVFIFIWSAAQLRAQTGTASLRGRVTDPSGAIVPGASLKLTAQSGGTHMATASAESGYEFKNLPPGEYEIEVTASGFAPYTKDAVEVNPGQSLVLNISLSVAAQKQQVTVSGEALALDTASSNNASAVVLTQKELDALPDDPDELQADLQALAGPGAGPNGGQMYIDGFTAGQLPPKSSIREIRINSNPFSAEYDTPGLGRIEIFTKPGGSAFMDYLLFRRMVTPWIVITLYYFVAALLVLGGIAGFPQTSTWLIRREFLLEVPFTKGLKCLQDLDWLLHAFADPRMRALFVDEPLAIFHNDYARDRVATWIDWQYSYRWAMQNRHLFTRKAFGFFLVIYCVNPAAQQGAGWSELRSLLRDCRRYGRTTLKLFWLYALYTLIYPIVRKILPAERRKTWLYKVIHFARTLTAERSS